MVAKSRRLLFGGVEDIQSLQKSCLGAKKAGSGESTAPRELHLIALICAILARGHTLCHIILFQKRGKLSLKTKEVKVQISQNTPHPQPHHHNLNNVFKDDMMLSADFLDGASTEPSWIEVVLASMRFLFESMKPRLSSSFDPS